MRFPFKQKIFNKTVRRGTSVIEMLAVTAIFSFIVVISAGSLVNAVQQNRESQAVKTSFDNLTFALSSMGRNIRLGYNYYCGGDETKKNLRNDCPAGGNSISFNDYRTGNLIVYRLNGTTHAIERYNEADGYGYLAITAPEINIDSLKFFVARTGIAGFGPVARVQLSGVVTVKNLNKPFFLETLLAERPYNDVP